MALVATSPSSSPRDTIITTTTGLHIGQIRFGGTTPAPASSAPILGVPVETQTVGQRNPVVPNNPQFSFHAEQIAILVKSPT
ncbi:hypothetical protein LTR17_025839, partial [Elasticomyces elasticus]